MTQKSLNDNQHLATSSTTNSSITSILIDSLDSREITDGDGGGAGLGWSFRTWMNRLELSGPGVDVIKLFTAVSYEFS